MNNERAWTKAQKATKGSYMNPPKNIQIWQRNASSEQSKRLPKMFSVWLRLWYIMTFFRLDISEIIVTYACFLKHDMRNFEYMQTKQNPNRKAVHNSL